MQVLTSSEFVRTSPQGQPQPPDGRLDGPGHTWFGQSDSSYLVVPRTFIQSMALAWQAQFVDLVNQLRQAFAHVEQSPCYDVIAGEEVEVSDLTDHQLARLGISRAEVGDGDDLGPEYCDRYGHALDPDERIIWPTADPVPHYDRGRAFVRPAPPFDRPGE